MANHFASVGFKVSNQKEWAQMFDRVANEGDETAFEGGTMFRWLLAGGEELSILVDDGSNFRGGAPHFAGSTRVEVALDNALPDPEGYWEGAFYAWMNPQEDLQSGDCPFVFDVADFWIVKDQLNLPQRATVQIAAFAHEVEFFASETEYDNSQTDDIKYAPNFFIPSGLFTDDESVGPQPYALFAGTILRYQKSFNSVTNEPFHHFEVETLGGVFDVVAEDEVVTQAGSAPKVGGLLRGTFWMSGQVLKDH